VGGFRPVSDFLASLLGDLRTSAGYQVGAWLLAFVFLWSGAVKLRRPALAALAITDFGVTRRPKAWQGAVLGAFELLLGVALAVGWRTDVALVISAAVLSLFAALLSRSVLRGERFPCFCFGAADESISYWAAARTLALAVLAGVLWSAPLDDASRTKGIETLFTFLTAVALLSLALLIGQIRPLVRWNSDVARLFGPRAAGER